MESLKTNFLKLQSDISIIQGIKKGNASAYKALFKKYGKTLFSTCLRYAGNQTDAEDVLQDAFIRIFKYFENFDQEKGNLKNWMSRICANEALDQLKAKTDFEDLEKLPKEPTAEPVVLSNLQMKDLMNLIVKLPLPYRTVFNLYLVEGYSHAEIAALLNIEASSSRSILTRAKAMVRKRLNNIKHESWT